MDKQSLKLSFETLSTGIFFGSAFLVIAIFLGLVLNLHLTDRKGHTKVPQKVDSKVSMSGNSVDVNDEVIQILELSIKKIGGLQETIESQLAGMNSIVNSNYI